MKTKPAYFLIPAIALIAALTFMPSACLAQTGSEKVKTSMDLLKSG
jgi:hypothetical protein